MVSGHTDLGSLKKKLVAALNRARTASLDGETLVAQHQDHGAHAKARQAFRNVNAYQHRLQSLFARQALDDTERNALIALLDPVVQLLNVLKHHPQ